MMRPDCFRYRLLLLIRMNTVVAGVEFRLLLVISSLLELRRLERPRVWQGHKGLLGVAMS